MNLNIYSQVSPEVTQALQRIESALSRLHEQGTHIMSVLSDLQATVEEIKTAIADVASDVDEILAKVPEEGGMTKAEVDELRASLTGAADSAKAAAAKYPTAPPPDEPPNI